MAEIIRCSVDELRRMRRKFPEQLVVITVPLMREMKGLRRLGWVPSQLENRLEHNWEGYPGLLFVVSNDGLGTTRAEARVQVVEILQKKGVKRIVIADLDYVLPWRGESVEMLFEEVRGPETWACLAGDGYGRRQNQPAKVWAVDLTSNSVIKEWAEKVKKGLGSHDKADQDDDRLMGEVAKGVVILSHQHRYDPALRGLEYTESKDSIRDVMQSRAMKGE